MSCLRSTPRRGNSLVPNSSVDSGFRTAEVILPSAQRSLPANVYGSCIGDRGQDHKPLRAHILDIDPNQLARGICRPRDEPVRPGHQSPGSTARTSTLSAKAFQTHLLLALGSCSAAAPQGP